MRRELCDALVARSARPETVFLTGDLGFGALEPLRDAMGPRFINAGVAEQNMITVAAALASEGLEPWTYTIAPFCYARAFEQIRNDVCLHGLPVRMLANGGGYGYGVMGATHHALEDYGVLSTLPALRIFVPCFDGDVAATVEEAGRTDGPAYIRLGRGELPAGRTAPAYAPWRKLSEGTGAVVVAVGPLAGIAWGAFSDGSGQSAHDPSLEGRAEQARSAARGGDAPASSPHAGSKLRLDSPSPAGVESAGAPGREVAGPRPEIWAVSELPIARNPPPPELIEALRTGRPLCVVEEHVTAGGVGPALVAWCLEREIAIRGYRHLAAAGYPSGRYGSQAFHRRESGLDAPAIRDAALALAA